MSAAVWRSGPFWADWLDPSISAKTQAIEDLLARPLGTTRSLPERVGLELVRSISTWVKDYAVVRDL